MGNCDWEVSIRYSPFAIRISHKRQLDLAALLQPCRHRQVLRTHESRVEQLRLIAVTGVAEDGHDRLAGAELLGKLDCARDIDAGGAAEAQALMLEQIVDDVD